MADQLVIRGRANDSDSDTLLDNEMLSPNSSHNGSHDSTQNAPVPEAQSADPAAQAPDHHKEILAQLATTAIRMSTFHRNLDTSTAAAVNMTSLYQEFSNFASEMSKTASDLHERLMKSESERDKLRESLIQQRYQQRHLERELERLMLQQRQKGHQEQEHEQQQEQSRNMHLHDAEASTLLSNPATPSSKRLPADFPNFTVPASNPGMASPFNPKLGGFKKPKSERTSARKALKIKIPGGPIPMASLKPAKSADARLQETVASPVPVMAGPASAPMPSTLPSQSASSAGLSEAFPSPYAVHSASYDMVPPSPFLTAPSPSGMTPRTPFGDTAYTSGMETPTRSMVVQSPSGMEIPSRYVTTASSSAMGPSTPFVAIPSSSGMTPQARGVGVLSSSDLATPTSFITGPPPSAMAAPIKSPNYGPVDVDLSPLTPDRIGPNTFGDQRTMNSVLRRRLNNLASIFPPANAFIPEVPLTDTEIIVFFFQSLSRPAIALRLYARQWGPMTITAALNKHRNIAGGYLRNTTSVKCTSAIKKGKDRYGDNWYEDKKVLFANANDWLATELIRQTDDELDLAADFELSKLDTALKQYPREGVDGGIFTRCVKWCCENKNLTQKYTLRNVHHLVLALRWGEDPGQPGAGLAFQGAVGDMMEAGLMGDTGFGEVEDADEYEGVGEYEGKGKARAM